MMSSQHNSDAFRCFLAKAIFIGDDGQGDVQAALSMACFGPPFAAAFIHQVTDKARHYQNSSEIPGAAAPPKGLLLRQLS